MTGRQPAPRRSGPSEARALDRDVVEGLEQLAAQRAPPQDAPGVAHPEPGLLDLERDDEVEQDVAVDVLPPKARHAVAGVDAERIFVAGPAKAEGSDVHRPGVDNPGPAPV